MCEAPHGSDVPEFQARNIIPIQFVEVVAEQVRLPASLIERVGPFHAKEKSVLWGGKYIFA